MDTITLTAIEVWGHHGVLPHERTYGQPFVVDARLHLDLGPAGASDDLHDTVDYGALSRRIHDVVAGGPHRLLERVADEVLSVCLEDDRVQAAEVTVHKPRAPFPVPVGGVAVTMRRDRSAPDPADG